MQGPRFRGDPNKLSAAEINRWNQLANQHARGELRTIQPPTLRDYDPSSRIAFCKNTSGADRAAGDTMAIDGLLWDLDTSGVDDVIFKLITADPDLPPAILLEPIETDGFGRAVISGPALAKLEAGSVDLEFASPAAASHSLEPDASGTIRLLAAPNAGAVSLVPVIIGGATGSQIKYFILKEDATGIDVWAKECNRLGTGETGDYTQVGNWSGLIDGAQIGYYAQFALIAGNWDITLGDCPGGCQSDGTITPGSPPAGTAGVAYVGHTVASADLNSGSLAASGLPAGLSMDTAGAITGTPTTAGTYYVTITGTSPTTADGVTGDCTITRIMVMTIEAP